jgi:DNA-binding transcriptional LysR family regulator
MYAAARRPLAGRSIHAISGLLAAYNLCAAHECCGRSIRDGSCMTNLNALRVFATAAAEGSYSAAARRLGMTQPSVSEYIQSLENEYGLPLFERAGRSMGLTKAGRRLYEHTARILADIQDLERDLGALKDGTDTILDIIANPVPGEAVLPLLLPGFRELQPRAQVRERIGGTREAVDRLLRREVELAVVVGPFHDERIEAAFLARDEFALIARGDHPLAGRGPLRATEVCQYPLVLRREGSGTRQVVENALIAAGVKPSSMIVAAELGNTSAVRRAVEAGLGVAFVSRCTLPDAEMSGNLLVLPLADEPPARDLLVLTEHGRRLTVLAASLRQYLLSPETQALAAAYTRVSARPQPSAQVRAARKSPGSRMNRGR